VSGTESAAPHSTAAQNRASQRHASQSSPGQASASTVAGCAQIAARAAAGLAAAPAAVIDEALRAMAGLLGERTPEILAANAADVAAGETAGLGQGLLDRLRLGEARITEMARQLGLLADAAVPPEETPLRDLPGGLTLTERRVPVGVIGANYEARPNVTVDVASQLLKSRNAGVLRTGTAALRSAAALADHVIAPALAAAGLDPGALQLVRSAGREAAQELVSQPGLIPLVILRGSGESTRLLAAEAARHGVRTLAHADGGGVLYLDRAADPVLAGKLISASLDRLGVCNRLNLLLICGSAWMSCCRWPAPRWRPAG
jgi:glutamate-5-semialdehyde dehydrogenase